MDCLLNKLFAAVDDEPWPLLSTVTQPTDDVYYFSTIYHPMDASEWNIFLPGFTAA